MLDDNNPILIDIQSNEINCYEQSSGIIRYNLGYIMGEFAKIRTVGDLFVIIHYKRGLELEWEKISFKLNSTKSFKHKLPAGLTVVSFYVQILGYITKGIEWEEEAEFELTDLEITVKEVPIGKFAGEPLRTVNVEPQANR